MSTIVVRDGPSSRTRNVVPGGVDYPVTRVVREGPSVVRESIIRDSPTVYESYAPTASYVRGSHVTRDSVLREHVRGESRVVQLHGERTRKTKVVEVPVVHHGVEVPSVFRPFFFCIVV